MRVRFCAINKYGRRHSRHSPAFKLRNKKENFILIGTRVYESSNAFFGM